MENSTVRTAPTFEDVWAVMRENALILQETDRIVKANALQMQETDRLIRENAIHMKSLQNDVGGWSNNHGAFAEEYFHNAFKYGNKNFFGQNFETIYKNIKGIRSYDEYDILLVNGESIGIIEVKFKARLNKIPKTLKKSETLRLNFPEFANHRVYVGLAAMVFDDNVEDECVAQGIAIIKQVGDAVIIKDGHLKAF